MIFLRRNVIFCTKTIKLDNVRRVQFLTGRRHMKNFSWGSRQHFPIEVGAYMDCPKLLSVHWRSVECVADRQ